MEWLANFYWVLMLTPAVIGIYCAAQAVRDFRARRYAWAVAGAIFAPVLFAIPIPTYAVKLDMPRTMSSEPPLADKHSFISEAGYVPDSSTAINVALSVLEPVYGKDTIEREKPFRATLNEDVWTVEGTLSPGNLGGTAVVEIDKRTARIIRMTHGK